MLEFIAAGNTFVIPLLFFVFYAGIGYEIAVKYCGK